MALGLTKTPSGIDFDLEVPPDTDFLFLMETLSQMHPGCKRLTNIEDSIFKEMFIVVNGEVVFSNELDQLSLVDQTNMSFVMRYQGG